LTEFREVKPARRGFDRLTPLEGARQAILAQCSPAPVEARQLDEAIGFTSSEAIYVPQSIPNEAIALRDGFAVAAIETLGASAYAPVFSLSPPQWVNCGDSLLKSTDAVLPSYAVRPAALPAEILVQAAPREGTRPRGEDFKAGAIIVEAGEAIRPVHLGLLKAAGLQSIKIRVPRLAILVRRDLPQGDLIGPSFCAFAKGEGAHAHISEIDTNEANAFSESLKVIEADLIVSVGGTGFGDRDHAAAALRTAGTLLEHGLALRPGETAGCGFIEKPSGPCPVILAPGRPEAALTVWLSLVRPCLAKMTSAMPKKPGETLTLSRKITSNPGVADIVLLRRATFEGKTQWEPLASGDLPWHALARAEAFHIVPPESEGYPAGAFLCAEEI
jgi:molybdopterin biosynthesis enzyme